MYDAEALLHVPVPVSITLRDAEGSALPTLHECVPLDGLSRQRCIVSAERVVREHTGRPASADVIERGEDYWIEVRQDGEVTYRGRLEVA